MQANSGAQIYGGSHFLRNNDVGEIAGGFDLALPQVASVGAGAAATTVQSRAACPFRHRRRGVRVACATKVDVSSVAPTVDVYATLAPPTTAPTLALVAAAGSCTNGAHKLATAFGNATGKTTVGPTATITVVNNAVAGQILASDIEVGPPGTTVRYLYMTLAAGTQLVLVATISNNLAGQTATINLADAALALAVAQTTGTGLNDIAVGGAYTLSVPATYTIEITSAATPDVIRWRKNAGSWTTGVNLTGSAQSLSDGVTFTAGATTGHTLGDVWTITAPAYDATANGSGATILAAPISLAAGDTLYSAAAVDDLTLPPIWHPAGVIYSARCVTGASTGAITVLDVQVDLERIPEGE